MQATAALILAAGLGTRFGGRKLLAPIDGKPMLQHVLDLAADAGLSPVVVVLGTDGDELLANCTWREEIQVFNWQPSAGLSGSIARGIAAMSGTQATRTAVLLGDQPFLAADQLDAILDASGDIVVPRYGGKPGNPVVLERSVWPLAASLQGDRGFSQLFDAHRESVTYVDVAGANPDIDMPADLSRA
jgi:molybdenum cofactor cytidylyltransferase